MRLGVLKNIIDEATDDNIHLKFEVQNLYEGKLFEIRGYKTLISALEILADQPWLDTDTKPLDNLIKEHGNTAAKMQVSPQHHNALSQIDNQVNQKLPIFYGILTELVDEQEEEIVNIKIPEDNIGDLESLSKFNKELQEVFKLIVKHKGLRGDVDFKGFDVGSSWYEILIIGGPLVYSAFMGVIEIADRLIQTRKSWYESEDIRLSVKAKKRELAKKDETPEPPTQKEIADHVNGLFEISAEELVAELIDKFPEPPNDPQEMQNSILMGLNKVIALIEKGTEFHPSLNPPEFVKQNGEQRFHVDYERLKKSLEKKEEPAQIEDQSDEDENNESAETPDQSPDAGGENE